MLFQYQPYGNIEHLDKILLDSPQASTEMKTALLDFSANHCYPPKVKRIRFLKNSWMIALGQYFQLDIIFKL